ncbi:MAG TPA: sugar transferase [Patescibacteria group bacterium]|nr:sugar transferase [Patescibacteria group bacterium]
MIYDFIKRIIDVTASIILLIIFSPIMLATAIVIKITSPGPIFVEKDNKTAQRVGKDGGIFYHYKFRSMMVNAYEIIKNDPKFRKHYEEYKNSNFKLAVDPRVTNVGRFIRKYSIDETPQFLNVLKGEMSLVGPRPCFVEELEEQKKKFPGCEKYINEMLKVKPGITGYWQVNGRSNINFDKRVEMDAYYAKRKSLLMDLYIILKTPFVMISGVGAV